MIKFSNLSAIILFTLLFSTTPFAQSNAVSRFKTGKSTRSKTAPASEKKVTIQRIEEDISNALTFIQDNHYSGDDLDYNSTLR